MSVKLHLPILDRLGQAPNTDERQCEWPGCLEKGPHRAPHSRLHFNKSRWFCKTHAANYNKAWNFLAHMTDEEVENIVRHDTVWNRPSWPIGSGPIVHAFMRGQFKDPFDTFQEREPQQKNSSNEAHRQETGRDLRQALATFEIEIPVKASEVKRRYKELVKRHHPDAQGTSKNSDDRIKEINHAYTVIMESIEA